MGWCFGLAFLNKVHVRGLGEWWAGLGKLMLFEVKGFGVGWIYGSWVCYCAWVILIQTVIWRLGKNFNILQHILKTWKKYAYSFLNSFPFFGTRVYLKF